MDQKLKYHKLILIGVLFFLTVNCIYAQYPGTNLRGKIQFLNKNNNHYSPLPNTTVDLYYSPSPDQFILIKKTITNANGFYFFYTIKPGNGNFYIQVNKEKNYQLAVKTTSYNNNKYNYNQFQDVSIINY
jgi:hypothetical protein